MAKLKIDRGTTYTRTLNYSVNGEPASLVGATVRFTVKTSEYDSDATDSSAVISKDVTDGTEDGVATITIEPSDTATLEPGKYFYDIKVQDSTGNIFKVDEGTIELDGSPTNRLS